MLITVQDPVMQKAVALHEAGKFGEAAAIYRDVLQKDPGNVLAMHLLALVAMQFDNAVMVLNLADMGLKLQPDFAVLHQDRATALRRMGDKEKAMQAIDTALRLDPDASDLYDTKAQIYRDLRDFDSAVAMLRKGLSRAPQNATLHNSLAICLHRMGRHEEALLSIDAYLNLKPEGAAGYNNKGNILKAIRRYAEAIECYNRALALEPGIFMGKANLGMCHLVLGEWEKGWPLFEDRKPGNMSPEVKRFDPGKRWKGEACGDKVLILYNEQGLGDTIQFSRYVPLVRAQVKNVILQVQRPLVSFMQGQFPDLTIADDHDLPPAYDLQCPLMSLPGIFDTTPSTVPQAAHYFCAPADRLPAWADALSTAKPKKVGIVWAGNPDHMNDHIRSIPLAKWTAVLAQKDVQFFALQKGEKPLAQIKDLPEHLRPKAIGEELKDFNDTAAALTQLDLLITVDTSVLHLAGALGRPAWALLQFDPDWRWMVGREDTPWYDSIRLFRQNHYGDWNDVLARVAHALQQWVSAP